MRVTLTLEALKGWPNTPERRLARLLKAMLRGYGWRCVNMTLQNYGPGLAQHARSEPRGCQECGSEAKRAISQMRANGGQTPKLAAEPEGGTWGVTPTTPVGSLLEGGAQ